MKNLIKQTINREKPERGHTAVSRGTLFLGRTAALTGSIFNLMELHATFWCYMINDRFGLRPC